MKRRSFLKRSSLASATVMLPGFLKAHEANSIAYKGRKLIVLQLSGGCDGLSAVVPFRNDIYYASRKRSAFLKSEILTLNDTLGFNKEMSGMKALYDDGLLNIINHVGYPNSNRSHFRSMDIWHSASDTDQYWSTGWLGRYLDHTCNNVAGHQALEFDSKLSMVLKGNACSGMATSDIKLLMNTIRSGRVESLSKLQPPSSAPDNLQYLYKTLASTTSSIEYLNEKHRSHRSTAEFPAGQFGKQLKSIASLICSGCDTSIYYASLSGFDTHANQKPQMNRLLKQLSQGTKALVDELKSSQAFSDTTIMIFSEFGRRVKENASGGTDHGAANNVYIISEKLRSPGLQHGDIDLSALDSGDLAYKVDFRSIYADVLRNWLHTDDTKILKKSYKSLNLFKSV